MESFDEDEENDGASSAGTSVSSDLPVDASLDPLELEEPSDSCASTSSLVDDTLSFADGVKSSSSSD